MKSGGLFAGYGGLDMAIAEVFGSEPAWFSEFEPPTEKNPNPSQAAAKILAHHWPAVPNLGDITQINWDTVKPVAILGGGFPCQDVSLAGKRAGLAAGTRSGLGRTEPAGELGRPDAAERGSGPVAWGQYADAIRRWERALGRPAPAPTEPTAKGSQRLSPAFVEWMMGLPGGHVTDVPGVTRNAQLKALGNGVVPQQAAAALRYMLANHLTLQAPERGNA